MKQYLVTASEMKRYDANTIEKFKMPSLLLMERAALVTVEELHKRVGEKPCRTLVLAGCGNNGGDGLAVGRLLMLQGYQVDFCLLGDFEKCSKETKRQIEILREYHASFNDRIEENEYVIIIDAVFGIGLSREIEGRYREVIEWVNRTDAYVCSVDIPSGINADDGTVMGCAVRADLTVTYGFCKIGQLLYPGAEYAGQLVCRDMGIDAHSFLGKPPIWYTFSEEKDVPLPKRRPDGNKGTFGKVLVIAGSGRIYGAAMLAAKSCFKTGAGMVKVVTAVENRESLQQCLAEAMLDVYREDMAEQEAEEQKAVLEKDLEWADCILIGPGIGTGQLAKRMLSVCITQSNLPLVIDADGLNLLAGDNGLRSSLIGQRDREVVLTPHLGEFARLYGCSVTEAKERITEYPRHLAEMLQCTVVCKDARTVVAACGQENVYLNVTGNAGMATAGSGDVLAGMIAGLIAQGMASKQAAVSGVYLHGRAGDLAAQRVTQRSLMAADIIDEIGHAMDRM